MCHPYRGHHRDGEQQQRAPAPGSLFPCHVLNPQRRFCEQCASANAQWRRGPGLKKGFDSLRGTLPRGTFCKASASEQCPFAIMSKVSNDAAGLHAAAAKIAGRRVHTGRQNGGRSVVMVDHRVRRTAWFAAVLALGCAVLIAGKAAAAGKDAKPVATIQLKEGSV